VNVLLRSFGRIDTRSDEGGGRVNPVPGLRGAIHGSAPTSDHSANQVHRGPARADSSLRERSADQGWSDPRVIDREDGGIEDCVSSTWSTSGGSRGLGSAGTITVAGRIALDDSLNSLVGSLPDGWAPGARAARGAGGLAEKLNRRAQRRPRCAAVRMSSFCES
jgi:hypothetical protein